MVSNCFSGRFLSLLLLFALLAVPVFAAEPPKITISPQWRPGTTLDSIDIAPVGQFNNGVDDFRYVDVDIYVTTTVQFWSVQLVCTASPASLTSYDDPNLDGDPDNNNDAVIWGQAWGNPSADYAAVVEPYNPVTGARTITATILGDRYPMGGANGTRDIFLIATLRYRAKDIAVNASATFTCTSTFLNRNGTPVLVATYTAPPPLPVITGYIASGTALYQGRAAHAGITVRCAYWGDSSKDFSVLTSATGAWTYTTRAQGYYGCDFYGDTTLPATLGYKPDRYLGANTSFALNGLSYNMLPVTLAGGNVNFANTDNNPSTTDERIDMDDITNITGPASWNKAVTTGDANGDGKTNQADLTIAGSNFNSWELLDSRHIMFTMPRDYDQWQHSRVWLGGSFAGATTSMLATPAGDFRDMWATLSPDGKRIAFIRNTGNPTAAIPNNGLYIAPITNGIAGAPVLVTPANADYQALAPSWSPDGTRIAFICSWWDDGSSNGGTPSGFLADEGNLCLIDANGRNFRNFSNAFNVWDAAKTRIYPPTWLSNNEVLYGGAWHNSVCENTLCYGNLQWNDFHLFDPDIQTGGIGSLTIADMPVVRDDILTYRFYDNQDNGITNEADTRVIRWAQLDWNTFPDWLGPFETRVTAVAPFHMNVEYDMYPGDPAPVPSDFVPLSTDVDYYNASTMDHNIIFYESGGFEFKRAYIDSFIYDTGTPVSWAEPFNNYVHDIVGNQFNPSHTPYDPNDSGDYGDFVYGFRNTAEWLP